MSRLRIGVLSAADAKNPNLWSGTIYNSVNALQKYCGETVQLGPYPGNPWFYEFAKNKISRIITGKGTNLYNTKRLAKKFSQYFSGRISEERIDVIYAPAASTEVSYLETTIPIIGLSDSNYLLIQQYDSYKNLWESARNELKYIEELSFRKSTLLTYPTEWAAKSTINDCGVDAKKVFVAPFGANLPEEDIPDASLVIRRKTNKYCTLLFLGVDWERKGGEIALDTFRKMKKKGVLVKLIICGCVPPRKIYDDDVEVIPFLNKRSEKDKMQLQRLLLESDFLLLPTRAEAYGIVFCEASAFGIPSITTDVGGVTGVVANGKNGYSLPLEASGDKYATLIAEIWNDEKRYCELSQSSRMEFENRLNWKVWAETMNRKFLEILP